ncbi:MAG: tail fiber protein [Chitinophagaceae bacterium]
MSLPFLGQLQIFSFNFAPKGWALCNGQLLPINQNQALFSLLGTMYGGDGRTNFALPNLQGRVPMHIGNGLVQGQSGGQVAHTLGIAEMPSHSHQAVGSSLTANAATPGNNFWASNTGFKPYAASPDTAMDPGSISLVGGSQPHDNMSPCLALNMCIALTGIFPSRN